MAAAQPPPRRRMVKPTPEYSIQAPLGVPASPLVLQVALSELVKHLQYSRGQCEAPVDRMIAAYNDLEAKLAQSAKHKRVPLSVRRIGKYLQQLSAQLSALRALPFDGALLRRGAAVALLLGPSPLRPREVYTVRFTAAADDDGAGAGNSSSGGGGGNPDLASSADAGAAAAAAAAAAREAATAAKRLLRGVIVHGAAVDEWADVCAPTQCFLMVQAPAGGAGGAALAGGGFVPRRGYSPSAARAKFRVAIEMACGAPRGGSGGDAGGDAAAAAAAAATGARPRADQRCAGQTLEEQWEASMQLCDSDSADEDGGGGGDDNNDAGAALAAAAAAAAATDGGGITDPDALMWFQCVHAVKAVARPQDPSAGC